MSLSRLRNPELLRAMIESTARDDFDDLALHIPAVLHREFGGAAQRTLIDAATGQSSPEFIELCMVVMSGLALNTDGVPAESLAPYRMLDARLAQEGGGCVATELDAFNLALLCTGMFSADPIWRDSRYNAMRRSLLYQVAAAIPMLQTLSVGCQNAAIGIRQRHKNIAFYESMKARIANGELTIRTEGLRAALAAGWPTDFFGISEVEQLRETVLHSQGTGSRNELHKEADSISLVSLPHVTKFQERVPISLFWKNCTNGLECFQLDADTGGRPYA